MISDLEPSKVDFFVPSPISGDALGIGISTPTSGSTCSCGAGWGAGAGGGNQIPSLRLPDRS